MIYSVNQHKYIFIRVDNHKYINYNVYKNMLPSKTKQKFTHDLKKKTTPNGVAGLITSKGKTNHFEEAEQDGRPCGEPVTHRGRGLQKQNQRHRAGIFRDNRRRGR